MNEIKKILLIYNPKAGNGMFKINLDMIINRFQQHDFQVLPVRSGKPEHLELIMKEVKNDSSFVKIIAAGGDGSINIVVNAMKRNGVDLPLAVFPAGTANDFAYYFDLPNDIDTMIEVALRENYIEADIGNCNGKYFVNVAAMGSLVDLSQRTDPNLKNALGVVAYYLKGLGELHNLKPVPFTIESEEFSGTEKIYFMLVMNGISAGGFRKLGVQSSINDGVFDVILFKDMPLLDFLPLAINILQGKHDENKNIIYFQTKKIHIEADSKIGTDVDGEKAGEFPLDIEIVPKAIRVNVPADRLKE